MEKFKVLFSANTVGGQQEWVEVEPGTTVAQLLASKLADVDLDDFVVKYNRVRTTAEDLTRQLQPDDRVTVAPKKVEGGK